MFTLGFGYAGKTFCVMGVRMIASLIIWPAFENKFFKIIVSVAYTNPNVKIHIICIAITVRKQSIYYPQIKRYKLFFICLADILDCFHGNRWSELCYVIFLGIFNHRQKAKKRKQS